MDIKYLFVILCIIISISLTAQTQTWQWVKAGGSSSDNLAVKPAECKIAGCDAHGNVYAVGGVNGPNMVFDTFSSMGAYSANNVQISYLLFSYDCAGNMRWAKQIGDNEGDSQIFGVVTDLNGNTYFTAQLWYGANGGTVKLYLGDTVLVPSNILPQPYLCIIKYDSLGKLVWFKNFEVDTVYTSHTGQSYAYGLRLGSSGNLWMACYLDSNYAISPSLRTTMKGKYNVEVDPFTGNILGGYYTSNKSFGDSYHYDASYELDENENYYECGTLVGDFGAGGDTLLLAGHTYIPNTSATYTMPFIYSLDKHGNFRYIINNRSYTVGGFKTCKYDYQTQRLISSWGLDSMVVFGSDTFRFNINQFYGGQDRSPGLFAINTSGNILWGKYITYTNAYLGFLFGQTPTALYIDHTPNKGLIIYNNIDTLFNKDTSSSAYYHSKLISRIDKNGNLIATHTAHLGVTGNLTGNNWMAYGAIDWRGNVYLGGTITNFFATPTDSVVNTDINSGNFLIAKLGISDCLCPTPGVQFTHIAKGDTVYFFGNSINHSDSIHWRLGDGTFIRTDTFIHVYAHDSTYTVTAIAYSGCGLDSITKQITVRSVGILPIESDKTNLYPNPVKNTVNLEVTGPAMIGLVYANGASVWQSPVQINQQGTYVFDMSKYSSALYYFIVQYTNGKTDVMQVVKE